MKFARTVAIRLILLMFRRFHKVSIQAVTGLAEVVQYVQNQRGRHRTKTFQEEYRAFLEAHEIQRDERYLWG